LTYRQSRNYRDARAAQRNAGYAGLTNEDIQSLIKAYNQLQATVKEQEQIIAKQGQQIEQQTRQLENQTQQLEQQAQQLSIKDEALARQKEDINRLDSELLWTKAALEQAEEQAAAQTSDRADQEWQERYTRLQAEMDNLRKRWEQRAADRIDEERHRLLRDMLPLADHLEMALQHAESLMNEQAASEESGTASERASEGLNRQFIDNIRATLQAFRTTLTRYDVEPIAAAGQPFDPNLHEAVGRVESDAPADHIAEVVQTGYISGDKLLRPARVLVSGG